jgi:hypothetical protein
MLFGTLATPPRTPITPQEAQNSSQQEISSLKRLEQRIAALEIQNATLVAQVQTLCSSPSSVDTKSVIKPGVSFLPTPSTPGFSESQSSTDRRCFALAKRVEALQYQLNQCVDACSSALELERNIRTDVELDNERLADEVRVLRLEKDSLQRQVRRYKLMAHPPVVSEEEEQFVDDTSRLIRPTRRAGLRISACSEAPTLIDDDVETLPLGTKRSSFRGSWYLAARKARSMVSLDLSNFAESFAALEGSVDPKPDDPVEPKNHPSITEPAPEHELITKRSSDVMKRAVHRASRLFSDVVRTYGDLSIVEGVVL